MPIFQLSQKDIDKGYLFDPDWYRVKIVNIGEKPSKDGGSINYPVEAVVLCNASNGNKEGVEGKSIEWNFNNKAIGFVVGFLKALGVEPKADTRYDFGSLAGREVEIYIARGEYNGNPKNEVNHKYRPVTA